MFNELKKVIEEHYGSVSRFCNESGYCISTIVRKLNCERNFTRDDIIYISSMLGFSPEDIPFYFFNDYTLDKTKLAV